MGFFFKVVKDFFPFCCVSCDHKHLNLCTAADNVGYIFAGATMRMNGIRSMKTSFASPAPNIQHPAQTMVIFNFSYIKNLHSFSVVEN